MKLVNGGCSLFTTEEDNVIKVVRNHSSFPTTLTDEPSKVKTTPCLQDVTIKSDCHAGTPCLAIKKDNDEVIVAAILGATASVVNQLES